MAPPAVTSALKTLRQADKGALSGKAGSLFTGKGLGSSGKGKGKLKKASPLIFVLALIFGAAALLFGIQGLLPFHLEANVTEATDPQYAYMLATEAYAFAKTVSTGSVLVASLLAFINTVSPLATSTILATSSPVYHLKTPLPLLPPLIIIHHQRQFGPVV